MSGVVTEAASTSTHRTWRLAGRLVGFAAASLSLGAAAGVIWWLVVKPPAYELNSNMVLHYRFGSRPADRNRGMALATQPRLVSGAGGVGMRNGGGSHLLARRLSARARGLPSSFGSSATR